MQIDFSLLWQVSEKILLVVIGAGAAQLFSQRPRLVVYYGHIGEFRLQQPSGKLHTHSVVIRNTGRLAANNVRVPHRGTLTAAGINISIEPDLPHQIEQMSSGGEQILFSKLAPRQQVTISYLYPQTIVVGQINLPIYCDEGQAKVLEVLPTSRPPRWVRAIAWIMAAIGLATTLYFAVQGYNLVLAKFD
jgi:hypothetical protein